MTSALRAEWLRLRRRPDIWVALAIVALFGVGTLVITYVDAVDHAGGFGSVDRFPSEMREGLTLVRRPFAFPQSLLSVLAGSWPISLAVAFVALATIGGEFSWGTVRSSVLAGTSRTSFLLARFAALTTLVAVMLLALLVIGLVFPVVLSGIGEPLPDTQPLTLGGLLADYTARFLAALAYTSFAAFLAATTRSMAAGTLLAIGYLLAESLLLGSATRSIGPIGWPQNLSLAGSTEALIDAGRRLAGELSVLPELREPSVPAYISLVAVVAWILAPALAAIMIFRRADITE